VNLIEQKITKRTKAIIIQNTFGLSTNVEDIIAIAKTYQLITIDDCTHGFGGRYGNHPNGSFTDAAFFSSQWNKPFSTGLGGYLMINNPKLVTPVTELYRTYQSPTWIESFKLLVLIKVKQWAISDRTYWFFLTLYRWLSNRNLIIGSSQGEELCTLKKPQGYEKKMGWAQINAGIQSLKEIHGILSKRKKTAMVYGRWLKSNNKTHVDDRYHHNHSWLKYPIRVKNRAHFFKLAQESNITLGDWFVSPLHPIKDDWHRWMFTADDCPNARNAAKELVSLETDCNVPQRVIDFLEQHKHYVL